MRVIACSADPQPTMRSSAACCVSWACRSRPCSGTNQSPVRNSLFCIQFLRLAYVLKVTGHGRPPPVSFSHFSMASISEISSARVSPSHGNWKRRRSTTMESIKAVVLFRVHVFNLMVMNEAATVEFLLSALLGLHQYHPNSPVVAS